jgi:predicted metalloendopeptidase
MLPQAFVNGDFAFFGVVLHGMKEPPPQWEQCVDWTENDLGFLLGKLYVSETLAPNVKRRVESMAGTLQRTFEQEIASATWIEPSTKEEALAKLRALKMKIWSARANST